MKGGDAMPPGAPKGANGPSSEADDAIGRSASEHLERVLSAAPVILFALDAEGVFTLSEGKGLEAFGLTPRDVVGRSVFEFRADNPRLLDDVRRALAGERFRSVQVVEGHHIETEYTPDRDETGAIRGVIGVAFDVTERVRAEEARREGDAKLRLVADSIPHFISYLDHDGRYLFVNRTYERWLGIEGGAIRGRAMAEVIGVEAAENASRHLAIVRGGHPSRFENVLRSASGEELHLEVSFTPDLDAQGRVRGCVVVGLDVSARTQAERSRREVLLTLETMSEGFLSFDSSHVVTYANHETEKFLGKPKDAILGEAALDVFPSPDRIKFFEHYDRIMRTGEPEKFEETYEGRRLQVHAYRSVTGGVSVFYRDVTEQHEDRRRLEASEKLLDQVFDKSPSFMAVLACPDYRWTRVNAEYQRIYERSDLIGKSVRGTLPEPEAGRFLALLDEVVRTNTPRVGVEVPFEFEKPDGGKKLVYVDFAYQPLLDADGRVYAVATVGNDVTEKVLARRRIEESWQEVRAYAEAMPQMAFVADREGNVISFNKRWHEYMGGMPGTEGWGWSEQPVVHPDDLQRTVDTWTRSLATGEPYQVEARLRRHDGEYRWHLGRAVPSRDENGVVVRWFGTNTDIEMQKRVSERAQFLSTASAVLADALAADAVVPSIAEVAVPAFADWCTIRLLDDEGKLVQRAVAHRDPSKAEWAKVLDARFPPAPDARMGPYNVVRTGRSDFAPAVTPAMLDAVAPDREHRAILEGLGMSAYICVPVRARGRAFGTLALVRTRESGRDFDEEDLKIAEDLGVRAGVALENARLYVESRNVNRIKDEFLATLSHELRTPLHVIQGNAEMLARAPERVARGEAMGMLDAIVRNARLQTRIISDLLDVSAIVTGKFALAPQAIPPGDVATAVVATAATSANAKGIDLACETVGAPPSLMADPARLQQILWNLVNNAVKFTPRGGSVRVRVAQAGEECEFEVTDTGVGIDAAFLPHVFDRFRQEESSMARAYGGLGLGLSIVRSLVELHGGRILAESKGKGRGATFRVRLPAPREPLDSASDASPKKEAPAGAGAGYEAGVGGGVEGKGGVGGGFGAGVGTGLDVGLGTGVGTAKHAESVSKFGTSKGPPLSEKSILVVEDNDDSRELASLILSSLGAKVLEAASVAAAKAILGHARPDALLCDIGMPGENGFDLMAWMRSNPEVALRSMPALALTSFVQPSEIELCLEAGFRGHLAKPIGRDRLLEALLPLLA